MERTDLVVPTTHDEHRNFANHEFAHHIVTGTGDFFDPAEVNPVTPEDEFSLAFEILGGYAGLC
jgi:hypothetical protein